MIELDIALLKAINGLSIYGLDRTMLVLSGTLIWIPLFIYIYFVTFLFYQAPVIAVRIFYYADILFLVYIFGNNEVRIRFHGLTVIMLILCVQCITFYNKTIINGENGIFVKGKFQFKQDNPIDELDVW